MHKEDLSLMIFRLRKVIEGGILADLYEEYNKQERNVIDFLDSKIFRIITLENEREDYEQSKKEIKEKYSLFGFALGLIDGTINNKIERSEKFGLQNHNFEMSLREKVTDSYRVLMPTNSHSYFMDYLVCNYPSYKEFNDFSSLSKEGLEFIKMYISGYQICNQVDLKKLEKPFKYTMNILINKDNVTKKYIKSIKK